MFPPPVTPRLHFDINIHTHTHTHTHTHVYDSDIPPEMTASTRAPAPDDPSSSPTELERLTALIDRASIASMEAMRLAIEVKGTFSLSNSDSPHSHSHSKIASCCCCRNFCTRQRTRGTGPLVGLWCPAHPRRPRRCSSRGKRRSVVRDRHRTRPGRLDGRTDGQPSRPVPELLSPQRAVPSPDGSEDGRPVHRKTEGRTDGTDDYDRIYCWLRVSESL